MKDPICYELRVISIPTGTSVKYNSLKSFLSFKASLELFFSRIMHAPMLQRLFETFVQPNTCKLVELSLDKVCHYYISLFFCCCCQASLRLCRVFVLYLRVVSLEVTRASSYELGISDG